MLKPYLKRSLVLSLYAGAAFAAKSQPGFIPIDADALPWAISADGSIVIGNYYRGSGFYWTWDTGAVPIGGNGLAGVSADGMATVGRANDAMGVGNAAIWQRGPDWQLIGSLPPPPPPS